MSEFLKSFLDEEIYIIPDALPIEKTKEVISEELVVESTTSVEEPKEVIYSHSIEFKGENKRNIGIVVNYTDQQYIDSSDEAFLMKILGAVQLTSDDVAIVNLDKVNKNEVFQLDANQFIFFTKSIHLENINRYSPTTFDGKTVLWANELKLIASDQIEKKALWENLKQIFSIN